MIKILFYIEKLGGGGAEKVLRDLVNHMDQSQFDITVQTLWPYKEGKLLARGIKYKSIYPVRNRLTESLYRIEAAKGYVYPLHMKGDFDIECAFLEYGPTKVIASSTNKKAKKIAWVHCDLSHALVEYAHTSYEVFAEKTSPWYREFDSIICVSKTAKKAFDQIFHSAFHSDVLYNVVEDEMIRKKAEEKVPTLKKRKLTLLAVGTMYPPKNYPRLLRTHLQLLQEGIDHDLWILGDGVERKQIEKYIQKNLLTDSVKLFGFQENPYPYMKAADVIVCSSNYEGFSTVITESVILGKPIVTTDCSGMKEILGENQFGVITSNSDKGFYEGVKQMITAPSMRTSFASKAKERGRDFSMNDLVFKTEQFFKTIVNAN